MSSGTYIKIYDCTLTLLGRWETPEGTYTVDAADLLIIAKILQFAEKGRKCILSDKKLLELTGSIDKSAIQKRLRKLERLKIIQRNTYTEAVNGKQVIRRELSVIKMSRDGTR